MNYILKNGYSLNHDMYKDILILRNKINKIENEIDTFINNTKVIDLNGRLIFDGFVDGHMHIDKSFTNKKVPNCSGTLNEAIENMGYYKMKMTSKDIKERADALLTMAYANGTRFIRTHVDVDDKIELKSLLALLEIKEQWKDKIELQIVAFPEEGIVNNIKSFEILEESMKLGADIIGGIPAQEDNPSKHMEMIFNLANKYDVDIDMHIDETDDKDSLSIKDLCQMTILNNYEGRVTAGHLCSLAANNYKTVEKILDLIKKAKINVISLPSTNLYLQGREDEKNIRRGIAPIKRIFEKKIPTVIASDNVRDPFNPFGNAKLLEIALIAAHGCHMGGYNDLDILFDMISLLPRKCLGFHPNLSVGETPKFVILNNNSKADSIISQSNIYGYFDKGGSLIIKKDEVNI